MKHIYSFEKLEVWQESRKLVSLIYCLTKKFPELEKFGLSNQMQMFLLILQKELVDLI